jgi:hypothetical protein
MYSRNDHVDCVALSERRGGGGRSVHWYAIALAKASISKLVRERRTDVKANPSRDAASTCQVGENYTLDHGVLGARRFIGEQ